MASKLESKQVEADETISLTDSSSNESDEERSVVASLGKDDCGADFEDIDEKLVNPAANFTSVGGS